MVSVFRADAVTYFPFAVAHEQPIPLQVLASPADGVAKPFAVVLRLSADSPLHRAGHTVVINGVDVAIATHLNGNGEAAWTLPDGTRAYLRSRGLDENALTALIARLTPRDHSAPIPGFDLQPSSDPDALVLLHERLNTNYSGTVTTLICSSTGGGISRIRVLDGDPVYVYFGIIDTSAPTDVGVNGDGAITITTTGDQTVTLAQVIDADPATWAALPTAATSERHR